MRRIIDIPIIQHKIKGKWQNEKMWLNNKEKNYIGVVSVMSINKNERCVLARFQEKELG